MEDIQFVLCSGEVPDFELADRWACVQVDLMRLESDQIGKFDRVTLTNSSFGTTFFFDMRVESLHRKLDQHRLPVQNMTLLWNVDVCLANQIHAFGHRLQGLHS